MQTLQGGKLIKQLGIDYFKDGSTFGAISEETLKYMVEHGEVIQLNKGETLYQIGDPGSCFYITLQGTVRLSGLYKGEIRHARDFTFGEQFGFVAMISLEKQIANAQALEDSIVLEVSSNLFLELHEKFPSDFGILMLNLSREIARRFRELFPLQSNF